MEEKEKRRRTIQIRLSDEEYEAIEKKFRNSGMKSKSDFIRSMILQGYITLVDYEKEIELYRKVKGISVNINQIAKRVNATGNLYADDLAELQKGVSEIWQQQKSFQSKKTRLGHLDTLPIQTKTDGGRLIRTYYCSDDPAEASQDFQDFRDLGTGKNTVLSQHFIQSFLPGEVTPEEAMEVGEELCRRLLQAI